MKIFKGKAFFIKSFLLHIFLVAIIAFVSINFWENSIYDTFIKKSSATTQGSDAISLVVMTTTLCLLTDGLGLDLYMAICSNILINTQKPKW